MRFDTLLVVWVMMKCPCLKKRCLSDEELQASARVVPQLLSLIIPDGNTDYQVTRKISGRTRTWSTLTTTRTRRTMEPQVWSGYANSVVYNA